MINVCFFSGDITRSGGTGKVGTVIANELQKKEEFNISFLSLWENHEIPFFEINDSINRDVLYYKESTGFHHLFGYIFRIRNYVKKNKIDVLIDIDGILDLYSIPALLGLNAKIISWEHFGFFSNPFVSYRKISRKMAAKKADAIVVLTNQDRENYINNLKIKGLIETIHNPIRENENVKYDNSSNILLSVGRLSHDKGFDMLIDVAQEVFRKNPGWKWIIAGEGEEREKLESKIEDLNLKDNIELIGNVTDIESVYKKASIFICTSRYEGFGLVLTEAKSFMLPCISFDCPEGPREIILEGENGFLIDCFDKDRMTEKINILINDKSLRARFSGNALEKTNAFDIHVIIKQWTDVIEKVYYEK